MFICLIWVNYYFGTRYLSDLITLVLTKTIYLKKSAIKSKTLL